MDNCQHFLELLPSFLLLLLLLGQSYVICSIVVFSAIDVLIVVGFSVFLIPKEVSINRAPMYKVGIEKTGMLSIQKICIHMRKSILCVVSITL